MPNQPYGVGSGQQGKQFPRNRAKGKLHQIKLLGGNSGASIVGGESGAAGWTGSFVVQITYAV